MFERGRRANECSSDTPSHPQTTHPPTLFIWKSCIPLPYLIIIGLGEGVRAGEADDDNADDDDNGGALLLVQLIVPTYQTHSQQRVVFVSRTFSAWIATVQIFNLNFINLNRHLRPNEQPNRVVGLTEQSVKTKSSVSGWVGDIKVNLKPPMVQIFNYSIKLLFDS